MNKSKKKNYTKKEYQKPVLMGEIAFEAAGATTCGKLPGAGGCTAAGLKADVTSMIS